MKVLHVTSDWKWTGAAQPMLRLLLAQRAAGDEVGLVCPPPPRDADGIAPRARAAGVEPAVALERARGARPFRDAPDAARLRRIVDATGPDVLHVWHTRDHVLARRASSRVPIVRTWSDSEPPAAWPWNRWLLSRWTDGVLCTSEALATRLRTFSGRPVEAVLGSVELDRFAPGAPAPGVRAALGLPEGTAVIGVVARVQAHRRFGLLLEAFARLRAADPEVRLLVLGRGTHREQVAREPAVRLGIEDAVVLAGYRDDDYVDAIRCMDLLTFLVPGSDGGCRALLEAQACGVPAVVSGRGALPEIVVDGETGRVVEEDADALVEAWRSLLSDAGRRARMATAARTRAERAFTPERLVADVAAFYRSLPPQRKSAVVWSSTSSR